MAKLRCKACKKACKNNKSNILRKKSQVEALPMIFSGLLLVGALIVFSILFTLEKNAAREELRGYEDVISGSIYSSAYLRMPVTVEDNDMKMADLVRLANENEIYSEAFEERTDWFLRHMVSADTCFYFKIVGTPDDDRLVYQNVGPRCLTRWAEREGMSAIVHAVTEDEFEVESFITEIPSFTSDENIKVFMLII